MELMRSWKPTCTGPRLIPTLAKPRLLLGEEPSDNVTLTSLLLFFHVILLAFVRIGFSAGLSYSRSRLEATVDERLDAAINTISGAVESRTIQCGVEPASKY